MATDRPRLGPGESSLSPDLIAQRGFVSARRGFDPDEVKAFLAQVADELRGTRHREATLERALRDAEERAAHPSLDENTLMAAVGEETARILRSAHTAAHDIRAKAEENAARILKEAHDRTTAMLGEAETVLARRTAEAEAVAARITEAVTAEAERLRSAGHQGAEALRAEAEAERKLTIEAAHAARERILNDLSRRRHVAVVQIEQLRAGRERLLEAYKVVRRTLDEVTGELQRADAEARAAADAAGRRPLPAEVDELLPAQDGLGADATLGSRGPGGPTGPGVGSPEPAQVRRSVTPLVVSPTGPAAPEAAPVARESADQTHEQATTTGEPAGAGEPGKPGDRSGTTVVGERRLASLRVLRRQKDVKEGTERPAEPPRPVNGDPLTTAVVDAPVVAEQAVSDGGSVDDLFARIRADREEAVAHARQVLGDETPAVVPDQPEAIDSARSDLVPDADELLLQRRDEAVGPIEVSLARKLKRALQDEQNALLDRLRGLRTKPTAASLLPAVDAHAERFSAAGRPMLDEAAKAGAAFAVSLAGVRDTSGSGASDDSGGSGASGGGSGAEMVDLDDLAAELAAAVVDPLRRRLEQAFTDGGDDDDTAVLVESLGAAYREWKTQRIEQTAADHIAAAFARGAFAATPQGTRLRWLVEDVDGPCPDCDDNALAGGLPKGEPFPTGQRWPPAHAGCRCLLVPDPA